MMDYVSLYLSLPSSSEAKNEWSYTSTSSAAFVAYVWRTLPSSGNHGPLPRVEPMGRGVDHSPESRSEIKNEWRYTFTPPVCFHGMCRNNFTFHWVWRFFTAD